MVFPERFSDLTEHVWPRLRGLLDPHPGGGEVLSLTIGEPRHDWPPFVAHLVAAHTEGFGKYPPNNGTPELLQAMADWVGRRFGVSLSADTHTDHFTIMDTPLASYHHSVSLLCAT